MKQAMSASDVAKSLMRDDKSSGDSKTSKDENKEVKKLKELLEVKEKELAKSKANEDAVKKQAKSLTEEYDRLMTEHQTLVKKQKKVEGESKKDS